MDDQAAEHPKPRLPEVPAWGLGPKEDLEAPAELPAELLEAIRVDLAEHEIELDVDRDVSWQGHVPKGAIIEAELASHSRAARFHCAICQRHTIVGDPVFGPMRTARQLRKDPALAGALRGADESRLDALVEAYERGELAPQINEKRLEKAGQRSRGKRRREANAHRRQVCQALLRRRIAEIGNLDTAVQEIHEALKNEEFCIKQTGFTTPPAEETLRKYWSGRKDSVSQAERNAAFHAYMQRPEAERNQIEKERRLGTLQPPDYLTP
jgi:hypothetical protein